MSTTLPTRESSDTMLSGRYELGAIQYWEGPVRVHRGWDASLQRAVLIRVLEGGSAEDLALFRTSVKAGAELMLEHTVTVFDAGAQQTPNGRLWWAATEYIEDSRPARFDAAGVLDLAKQLASTLAQVHTLGSAHGRLGPADVIVIEDRQVRVGGFTSTRENLVLEEPALHESLLASDLLGYSAIVLDWLDHCPLPSQLRSKLADIATRSGAGLHDFGAIVEALNGRLDAEQARAPRTAELPITRLVQTPRQTVKPIATMDHKQRAQRRNSAIVMPGFSILIVLGLVGAFFALGTLNNQTAPEYRIPAVANSTLAEAQAKINVAGLELGGQRSEASMSIPAGHVVGTDPASGRDAAAGSFVILIVFSGKPLIKLPAANGLSVADLRSKLEASFLTVEVTEKDGPDIEGAALAMSPAAGSSIEAGKTVKLTVASGFQRLPAGLLGKSSQDAVAALHALGLTARLLTSKGFDAPADSVYAVEPRDRVPVKGVVTLSVAAD